MHQLYKKIQCYNYNSTFDSQTESIIWLWMTIEMSQELELVAFCLKYFSTITSPCKVVVELKFITPLKISPKKLEFDINLSAKIVSDELMFCFPRAGILPSSTGASATTTPR